MNTLPSLILAWMTADRPDIVMHNLHDSGWLRDHAPELDRLYGVPQNPLHHPEIDTGRHIELSLQIATELTSDPRVRYAVLVHDLGKALTPKESWPKHVGHESLGVRPGLRFGKRIGVPREWRLLGALTARYHLRVHRCLEHSVRYTVRLLRDADFFARPKLLEPFLLACEADARGRAGLQCRPYPQSQRLRTAFVAAAGVEQVGHSCDYHQERIHRAAIALQGMI